MSWFRLIIHSSSELYKIESSRLVIADVMLSSCSAHKANSRYTTESNVNCCELIFFRMLTIYEKLNKIN